MTCTKCGNPANGRNPMTLEPRCGGASCRHSCAKCGQVTSHRLQTPFGYTIPICPPCLQANEEAR